jgi:fructose-1,6-bisphosphatase/inositol monophosphatase family enzyme
MKIPHQSVIDFLREAAQTAMLPRYRNLRVEDVSDKDKGGLVAASDRACEPPLAASLQALFPGPLLTGEEGERQDHGTNKIHNLRLAG